MTTDNGSAHQKWSLTAVRAWAIIGVLILVALGVEAVIYLWDALWPFVLALVVVVALNGPVSALSRRGWSRLQATAVAYLLFFLVLGLASWFLLPLLYEGGADLVSSLPQYTGRAVSFVNGLLHPGETSRVPGWVPELLGGLESNVRQLSADLSSEMARTAADVVTKALDILVKSLLGALVAFYVLIDLPSLRREIMRVAAVRHRDEIAIVFDRVSRSLGGWMRGTVVDSVIIGTLYSAAFVMLGVPYGLIIGVIGGFVNFVPWLGPAVTVLLATVAALFVSPGTALWVAIAVIVIRQIDDFLIAPRVLGDNVDLHPMLVVFSLLAGATLFGFVGLLLAIPFAAVAKSLFVYFYEKATERQIATEDGVLFRLTGDDVERAACEPARRPAEGPSPEEETNES